MLRCPTIFRKQFRELSIRQFLKSAEPNLGWHEILKILILLAQPILSLVPISINMPEFRIPYYYLHPKPDQHNSDTPEVVDNLADTAVGNLAVDIPVDIPADSPAAVEPVDSPAAVELSDFR